MDNFTSAIVILIFCTILSYVSGWYGHSASHAYRIAKEEAATKKERLEIDRRMVEWQEELTKEEPPEDGESYDFSGFKQTAGYWHAGNPAMKSGLGNNLFGKYIYGDNFDCRIAVALECDIKDWEELTYSHG